MDLIYHITTNADWMLAQKAGVYSPDSLMNEGFIHFSFADQVAATADRYYINVPDLIILAVAQERLNAEVRVETAPHGGSYPHLYGALNLDAVIDVKLLQKIIDGKFIFDPIQE